MENEGKGPAGHRADGKLGARSQLRSAAYGSRRTTPRAARAPLAVSRAK